MSRYASNAASSSVGRECSFIPSTWEQQAARTAFCTQQIRARTILSVWWSSRSSTSPRGRSRPTGGWQRLDPAFRGSSQNRQAVFRDGPNRPYSDPCCSNFLIGIEMAQQKQAIGRANENVDYLRRVLHRVGHVIDLA